MMFKNDDIAGKMPTLEERTESTKRINSQAEKRTVGASVSFQNLGELS